MNNLDDVLDQITLADELRRNQWSPGDTCMFRLYGSGEPIPGYILNVDIPTRRLEICYADGAMVWQYFEWAWRVNNG